MNDRQSGLATYVTSHGFGHLNRTVAVLNRIPNDIPIHIRCHSNLFDHWRERLTRPAEFGAYVSDAGALNPAGDSRATDGPGTLDHARAVHEEAYKRIDDEIDWMRENRVGAALCDAPPIPLVAARRAGIPAFLLANFTWADIYDPHARRIGPGAMAFVRSMRNDYRSATTLFRALPALAMRRVAPTIDVGMVVTPGKNRKTELKSLLGIKDQDKIVYFYVGRYGQANLNWGRVERFAERGIHFVGFHAASAGSPRNFHVVKPTEWTGADLAASADAIVAKAGYGTVCEAMAAGSPLIYPPRVGFAEHRALDRALRLWGGGTPVSAREFEELRLEGAFDRAFAVRPGPPPFSSEGALIAARRLVETLLGTSLDSSQV